METMKNVIIIIIGGFLLGGCATIMQGTDQTVDLLAQIAATPELTDEIDAALKSALEAFFANAGA